MWRKSYILLCPKIKTFTFNSNGSVLSASVEEKTAKIRGQAAGETQQEEGEGDEEGVEEKTEEAAEAWQQRRIKINEDDSKKYKFMHNNRNKKS